MTAIIFSTLFIFGIVLIKRAIRIWRTSDSRMSITEHPSNFEKPKIEMTSEYKSGEQH